ncbi:MAG: hypothetical protein PHO41_02915 [Eubacteriales bacterium]|nr:hypothetical protein [Eubacteriales bacterium]
MRRRVTAFIIILAMVVSFIPQTALAEETVYYDVYVKGIQVTSVNKGNVMSDDPSGTITVTYTPATSNTPATLTLKNANINATGVTEDSKSAIYYGIPGHPDNPLLDEPLIIRLEGTNELSTTAADPDSSNGFANGIYSRGPLTIIAAEPNASLSLTAVNGTIGNYGISAHNG